MQCEGPKASSSVAALTMHHRESALLRSGNEGRLDTPHSKQENGLLEESNSGLVTVEFGQCSEEETQTSAVRTVLHMRNQY
jgi:hypothetical protein